MTDTPAPTPESTPAPAPDKPWYDGMSAEEVGVLQNRGLDKGDYKAAVANLIKAHGEAQKFIGAPPDQMLRLPKDEADGEGWTKVWERLGRPAKADEYDLSGIKFKDGTALDDNMASFLKSAAFDANMPKAAAQSFAAKLAAHLDKIEDAESAETQANLQAEHQALKKSWGANFEANKFVAQQGAIGLGWDKDTVDKLEKVVGFGKMMEALRTAGQKFGEDKYVANRAPGGSGVMTREQAKAKLDELKSDTDWTRKFSLGDKAAMREFNALTEMIAGAEAA